jgi:hypothetical protein
MIKIVIVAVIDIVIVIIIMSEVKSEVMNIIGSRSYWNIILETFCPYWNILTDFHPY